MNALKRFGLGLLWVFLIPFILLGIALVAVFGVLNFPFQLVTLIVNFFRGKKPFPLFPEDEKAMTILQKAIDKKNGELEAPASEPAPQQVFVQQNYYGSVPPQGNLPYGAQSLPPQGMQPGIPYQNPQGIPYQNPQGLPGQIPQSIPYGQQPTYPQQQPPYAKPEFMTQGQLPSPERKEEMPKVELSSLPQYDEEDDR